MELLKSSGKKINGEEIQMNEILDFIDYWKHRLTCLIIGHKFKKYYEGEIACCRCHYLIKDV